MKSHGVGMIFSFKNIVRQWLARPKLEGIECPSALVLDESRSVVEFKMTGWGWCNLAATQRPVAKQTWGERFAKWILLPTRFFLLLASIRLPRIFRADQIQKAYIPTDQPYRLVFWNVFGRNESQISIPDTSKLNPIYFERAEINDRLSQANQLIAQFQSKHVSMPQISIDLPQFAFESPRVEASIGIDRFSTDGESRLGALRASLDKWMDMTNVTMEKK